MAVFAGIDLKAWREKQGISAADLAERISCDVTTIYRYESGKLKPNPDVMYEICSALGDPDKWTTWMRTEYPTSYGRVHPETLDYDLRGALMSVFADSDELRKLRDKALKDGADGKIDNEKLAVKVENALSELLQSAQRVRMLLKGSERDAGSKAIL